MTKVSFFIFINCIFTVIETCIKLYLLKKVINRTLDFRIVNTSVTFILI